MNVAHRTFFFFLLGLSFSSCAQKPEKPNVVIILVDDLGYKDLGFMGSRFYETPHLDKFATQGMVFTNGYAGAANCAPSRACLISGMNSPRHGVYTVSPSDRGDARTRRVIPVQNINFLEDSVYSLAEMMKAAGYVTGHFGKWHVGKDPKTQGFDVAVGGHEYGHPKSYFAPYIKPPLEAPDGEYLTDRLTNEAIQFMETNKDTSFFIYLPFYTVHTPLMGKEHLVEKYRNKEGVQGQSNPVYAAMVEAMDENVGRLLDRMTELNLDKNTLVFFTSDNGGIRAISSQSPLRAGKGSYYEGGIRVPFVARWPGNIKAHSTSETPVVNLDFYPTLLALTNQASPKQKLDGENLLPLLTGKMVLGERPLFWHFPIYLEAYQPKKDDGRDPLFRTRPGTIMRKGKWKLHWYYEDNALELYNLEEDPGERTNLADLHQADVQSMHAEMRDWLQKTNAAAITELNPEYDASFEENKIHKVLK